MRFKLVFQVRKGQLFPFNYQYELSAGLYKIFMHVKESLSKYQVMSNTDFLNHISFSRIEIPKRTVEQNGIRCLSSMVFLKVSIGFPDIHSDILWKAFAKYFFTLMLFKKNHHGSSLKIKLHLKDISFLPSPDFSSNMKFKMLSPMVLTKSDRNKNKYLSIREKEELTQRLKENLVEKFEQLYGNSIETEPFSISFDKEYCSKREEKDLYSLVTMKEGEAKPFSIMGLLVPFRIEAPAELIKVGYYSGFGEKTSFGFGMTEVI